MLQNRVFMVNLALYKEIGDTEYGLLQTTSRKGRSSVQVGA